MTQYSGRGRSRLLSTSSLICAQEISSSMSLGLVTKRARWRLLVRRYESFIYRISARPQALH